MRNLLFAGVLVASVSLLGACASESGGDITDTDWQLISITTQRPAFQGIVPEGAGERYTIRFNDDGTFNATADCNQVAGTYTIEDNSVLTIVPGPSTLVACGDESLGDEYTQALGQANSYTIAENQLTITLADDGTLSYQAAS